MFAGPPGVGKTFIASEGNAFLKTYRGEGPAYVHELFTLAQSMICHYGMDESIGMSSVDLQTVDSAYYAKIQERVNEILAEQLAEAKAIILKKSRDG